MKFRVREIMAFSSYYPPTALLSWHIKAMEGAVPREKKAQNELKCANVLQKTGNKFIKKYRVMKVTSKTYQEYIRQGKAFLKQLILKQREMEGHVHEDQEVDLPPDKLKAAFDNPSNKYSAITIKIFITQKCVRES